MSPIRIFVLYGQFGRIFSYGMEALAKPLAEFGTVTFDNWNDAAAFDAIRKFPSDHKLVVIGYSLGANELSWISENARRRIDLGVAYDPSKQSPLCDPSIYPTLSPRRGEQIAPKFDRIVCYWHPNAWVYGGAKYVGANVELVRINIPHLMVPNTAWLHERTVAEVRRLAA